MRFRIALDDADAVAALGRLIRAGTDMRPLMRTLAATLEDSVAESFAREGSPKGPWAPLAKSTVRRRGSARPILQHTGQLRHSVTSDHGPDWALAGVLKSDRGRNVAAFLQQGTSRMPARPFLALWPEHADDVAHQTVEFIRRVWRG